MRGVISFLYNYIVVCFILTGCYFDVKYHIIPIWCTLPIFILGIVKNVINEGSIGIVYALSGGICLVSIYILMAALFKGTFGGGDLKLLIAIGTFVGLKDMLFFMPIQLFCQGILDLLDLVLIKRINLYTRLKQEQAKTCNEITGVQCPILGTPFIIYTMILMIGGL